MNNIIRFTSFAGIVALSTVYAVSAKAAPTICKGQPQQVCETLQVFEGIPACKWMAERVTASGNSVKAHCRGSNKSVPADAKKKEVTPASNPSTTN